MRSDSYINLVFEDELSGVVMRRLIEQIRPHCVIGLYYRTGGKGNIKRKIQAFNHAAKKLKYLVLVDLDNEYDCPPSLINDWFRTGKNSFLYFRVAVQEVESWLLASRDAIANYLGVAKEKIPTKPDQIQNPKEFLLGLARNSRLKSIREDIVPGHGKTARIGPNYNARLTEFVYRKWNYTEAAALSPSLKRAIECIQKI